MKAIFPIICVALFSGTVFFQSCIKDSIIKAPPERLVNDTLTGHEFEFKDLTWERQPISTNNVIVYVKGRADLFRFPTIHLLKVSIRLDTTTVWQDVPEAYSDYSAGFDFYYVVEPGLLYIFPYPEKYALLGTKASIRIKFI